MLSGMGRRPKAASLAAVVGAALALLAAAPAAQGAKVSYHADGRFGFDAIGYAADPGENNQLRLYHDSALHERLRLVNLTDAVNLLLPAPAPGPEGDLLTTLTQCVVLPITAAYCRFRDVTNIHNSFSVSASLGDGNDLGRVSYVPHPGYAIVFSFNGGPGNDHLIGSPEKDGFDGGSGADRIDAGGGDDVIEVRDGEVDTVDCGAGNDIVMADEIDQLTDCENVTF